MPHGMPPQHEACIPCHMRTPAGTFSYLIMMAPQDSTASPNLTAASVLKYSEGEWSIAATATATATQHQY